MLLNWYHSNDLLSILVNPAHTVGSACSGMWARSQEQRTGGQENRSREEVGVIAAAAGRVLMRMCMTQVRLPAAPSRPPNQVTAGGQRQEPPLAGIVVHRSPLFRSPILLGGPLILNANGRGRLEKERKTCSNTKSNKKFFIPYRDVGPFPVLYRSSIMCQWGDLANQCKANHNTLILIE